MFNKYANSIELFNAQNCNLLKFQIKAEDTTLFSDHS